MSLGDELRRAASGCVRRRWLRPGVFTHAVTMSVSCRLEHGLGARSSGVSWVRSPSSVVRSHQLREADGDDWAGSREDRPRAPSQRFITEHLNRAWMRASDGARVPRAMNGEAVSYTAWHGVLYRHS